MKRIFLSAEWRKLIMANYIVPPAILEPYLPYGTEIDLWNGNCYASMVGFMFLKTRVLGIPIAWHQDFEEVNLRFYVRRFDAGVWKRGVVFISEIVPKPAISWVANTIYGENYTTCKMQHSWKFTEKNGTVRYDWQRRNGPHNHISVVTAPLPSTLRAGSEAEFITEHYFGYAKVGPQRTNEYAVEHPRWDVYEVLDYDIQMDIKGLYGPEFVEVLSVPPASVFMAEGSAILVRQKTQL